LGAIPIARNHRFGRYVLNVDQRRLLADGAALTLGARAFDVLCTLLERRDRIVSRDELLDAVWPGLVVEENNLSVQIGTLRRLLGAEAIATVPGRGYRFTLPVDADEPPAGAPAPAREAVAGPAAGCPRLFTNLPLSPTPLIGRDDDLEQLVSLLATDDPVARLITIVGAGGVGKTRLAQELLRRRAGAHRHGGCFVDLAPVPPGDGADAGLMAAVATALGLGGTLGEETATALDAMAPLDMLLVLDNAEHLLEPVGRLCDALLARAPGVGLVVTSQAPLRRSGEQVFRLAGLSVPSDTAPEFNVAAAAASSSVALFVARTRAADRTFALSEANVDAVVEICRRTEGLPLALELAAARVPLLGVRGLADALGQRLQVLSGGARSAPARQQTLRAALEWSLSLLSPAEQAVFRRMAVVASSASLATVQAIASDEGAEPWLAVESLGGLVDRSLVQVTGDEPPRYRPLDAPRALARDRLAASGEADAVALRHAHALRVAFEQACVRIVDEGEHQGEVMRGLALELNDARAALAWVRDRDLATAVSLAIGIGIVRSALGASTLDVPWDLVIEAVGREEINELPSAMIAWWAFNHSDYERSDSTLPPVGRAWAERAVVHASARGDRHASSVAQAALLAHLAPASGEAVALTAALESVTHRAPPFVRTTALSALVLRHWRLGQGAQAEASLERMLAILESQGATATARVARTSLIAFWLGRHEWERAVAMGRELEAELAGTRNERGLANCRRMLTTALLLAGRAEEARATCTAAWAASRTDPERTHPGWLDLLALLAAREGRWRAACLLTGAGDHAWQAAARSRGRTSVLVHQKTAALVETALGREAAARYVETGRAGDTLTIEAIALALPDAADSA
jgi:predicted ATPase/DNA-binding winged helix-turn-helix (wHTH) protein